MNSLPTGTVSLLFTDIEGSTALLRRLGPAYEEALRAQRRVLRKAWADHGGTELGTEGDSFYVVFPTAEAAVAAAVQGQRDLAARDWPGGEQMKVRMGIHTGSPKVSDGAYVGLDVHRAARIAAAAHGGQVVVSSVTAELASQQVSTDVVRLRDVGRHRLKDLPAPEHLFQLVIEGLRTEFPPLKSLGTTSSLPRPTTPLVGRARELADLIALLGSADVRLVTLTGPGGSGKTRVATALAEELVQRFPDGLHFVALEAVTRIDELWTAVADTLDVPPDSRTPPRLFDDFAHRASLLVLDNLEQIDAADEAVAKLLDVGPRMVLIATSRRPMHLPAEYEYPLAPLDVPSDGTLAQAQCSGAVQLFAQYARKVRPGFHLTAENAADVSEVCRRLDGLPLAIELAAARSKLLSPAALLARLDTALDIAAMGRHGPGRQKTLRDTIGWSCDLLTPRVKDVFADLGVFAGGADLEAISAVSRGDFDGADLLDLVSELVDVSLLAVVDTADGEPRVRMLETIRAYARHRLSSKGQLETVQGRHAVHFVELAESLNTQLGTDRYEAARDRLETEHDNFREALRCVLRPGDMRSMAGQSQLGLGLRLCSALGEFWIRGGYFVEMRRWLEQATSLAAGDPSAELAECLFWQARNYSVLGDLEAAHRCATESVAIRRQTGDACGLVKALTSLADVNSERGQPATARALFDEALNLARELDDPRQLQLTLAIFAVFEHGEHNYQRALDLNTESLAVGGHLRQPHITLLAQQNLSCSLRMLGRLDEAQAQMRAILPAVLQRRDPDALITFTEDYAAILADAREHQTAVRLLAAAEAMRERYSAPRLILQQTELSGCIAKCRAALSSEQWDDAYRHGRNATVEDVLLATTGEHR